MSNSSSQSSSDSEEENVDGAAGKGLPSDIEGEPMIETDSEEENVNRAAADDLPSDIDGEPMIGIDSDGDNGNVDRAAEEDLPSDIDGEPMGSDWDNDSTHSDPTNEATTEANHGSLPDSPIPENPEDHEHQENRPHVPSRTGCKDSSKRPAGPDNSSDDSDDDPPSGNHRSAHGDRPAKRLRTSSLKAPESESKKASDTNPARGADRTEAKDSHCSTSDNAADEIMRSRTLAATNGVAAFANRGIAAPVKKNQNIPTPQFLDKSPMLEDVFCIEPSFSEDTTVEDTNFEDIDKILRWNDTTSQDFSLKPVHQTSGEEAATKIPASTKPVNRVFPAFVSPSVVENPPRDPLQVLADFAILSRPHPLLFTPRSTPVTQEPPVHIPEAHAHQPMNYLTSMWMRMAQENQMDRQFIPQQAMNIPNTPASPEMGRVNPPVPPSVSVRPSPFGDAEFVRMSQEGINAGDYRYMCPSLPGASSEAIAQVRNAIHLSHVDFHRKTQRQPSEDVTKNYRHESYAAQYWRLQKEFETIVGPDWPGDKLYHLRGWKHGFGNWYAAIIPSDPRQQAE